MMIDHDAYHDHDYAVKNNCKCQTKLNKKCLPNTY